MTGSGLMEHNMQNVKGVVNDGQAIVVDDKKPVLIILN